MPKYRIIPYENRVTLSDKDGCKITFVPTDGRRSDVWYMFFYPFDVKDGNIEETLVGTLIPFSNMLKKQNIFLEWVKANKIEGYDIIYNYYYNELASIGFDKPDDALLFKLRWL